MTSAKIFAAMSDYCPVNDLDRAIIALQRSTAATPELYRRLGEGELSFLMPYHPEFEGGFEVKNGMSMNFSQIHDRQGDVVPLFSSVERAQEALEKFHLPPKTYALATMDAKVVLGILGKGGMRAVVNKGCETGEITIPPDLMRDVASGKVFEPVHLDSALPPTEATLRIVDPADYPTDFIQPLFEILKKHRNFRAAWIFAYPGEEKLSLKKRRYQVIVLMDPRDEVIFHEFAMVLAAARMIIPKAESAIMDENDHEYIAHVFESAQPFFVAPDYTPPGQFNAE